MSDTVTELEGKDFLALKRVSYGLDKMPVEMREYHLIGKIFPVGTVKEFEEFAKSNGFEGLRLFEKDGSVTFVMFDGDDSK